MRRAARVDDNQAALVAALRQLGISVHSTAALGDGFPDLCVGFRGRNYLLEVKDPAKVPSKRVLTPDEQDWHTRWTGQVAVVETLEDCLRVLGASGACPPGTP